MSYVTRRSPPACSASWSSGGWLGASFSRSPRRDQGTHVRVCWAEHGSCRGFLSSWSAGHSRSVAFHWVWRDQRQPRDVLLPSCALVPGMEKKSGSEPRRNGEQPPRSLPCPASVWGGVTETPGPCLHPAWKEEAGRGKGWGWVRKAETGEIWETRVAGGRGLSCGEEGCEWAEVCFLGAQGGISGTSDWFTQQSCN